jgi:hypothetical protein
MMISVFRKNNPRNIITNLCKIRIEETEEKVRIVTNIEREKLKIEPGFVELFAIGVTNDPYSEWSLDWGHLGCFKLGIKADNSTILNDKYLIAECKPHHFERRMNVPDRRMEELPAK